MPARAAVRRAVQTLARTDRARHRRPETGAPFREGPRPRALVPVRANPSARRDLPCTSGLSPTRPSWFDDCSECWPGQRRTLWSGARARRHNRGSGRPPAQKHELTSEVGQCLLIRNCWIGWTPRLLPSPSYGNGVLGLFDTWEVSAEEPSGRARGYEPHLDFDAEEKALTALTRALASPPIVASC